MAQADSDNITVPLYSLISDWKLRRIFWLAGRDLGDEFAVPAAPVAGLTGGAVAALELAEGLNHDRPQTHSKGRGFGFLSLRCCVKRSANKRMGEYAKAIKRPDPAFAAIEAHRLALKTEFAAVKISGSVMNPTPEAEAATAAACEATDDAYWALINTAPKTSAGMKAWVRYLAQDAKNRHVFFQISSDEFAAVLRSAGKAAA